MRTTLDVNDTLHRKAKRHAAEKGVSFTYLVEEGLRQVLEIREPAAKYGEQDPLAGLPIWKGGTLAADVDPEIFTSNAKLYALMYEDETDGLLRRQPAAQRAAAKAARPRAVQKLAAGVVQRKKTARG